MVSVPDAIPGEVMVYHERFSPAFSQSFGKASELVERAGIHDDDGIGAVGELVELLARQGRLVGEQERVSARDGFREDEVGSLARRACGVD